MSRKITATWDEMLSRQLQEKKASIDKNESGVDSSIGVQRQNGVLNENGRKNETVAIFSNKQTLNSRQTNSCSFETRSEKPSLDKRKMRCKSARMSFDRSDSGNCSDIPSYSQSPPTSPFPS
jgi:hypothetical protein